MWFCVQEQGCAASAGLCSGLFAVSLDVESVNGVLPNTEEEAVRKSDDSEPFSGLAFKIMNDPFVGSLTFLRIYSGVCNLVVQ